MLKSMLISLAWPIASACLNAILTFKTPEQWEAFVEAYPRGALVVKALRKVGLDLSGLIRLIQSSVAKRAGK